MRKFPCSLAAVAGMAAILALAGPSEVAGQELRESLQIAVAAASDPTTLRRFDALVETLTTGGELVLASSRPDAQLPGRTHEYFQQFHEGVPVYGAGVSRQQAGGDTVSLFGTIETGIELDPLPRFQSVEALELIEQQTDAGPLTNVLPDLVILKVPSGRHVLAYRATMRDLPNVLPRCAQRIHRTRREPGARADRGCGQRHPGPAQEAQHLAGRRQLRGVRPPAPRRDHHPRPALRLRAFLSSAPRRPRLGFQRRGKRRRQRVERPGRRRRACLHRLYLRLLRDPPGLARRGWEERPDLQHGQCRAGLRQCVLCFSAGRTGRARCVCLRRGRERHPDRVGRHDRPRAHARRDISLRPAAHRPAPARFLLVNPGTVELHARRAVQIRAAGRRARVRAELHLGSPGHGRVDRAQVSIRVRRRGPVRTDRERGRRHQRSLVGHVRHGRRVHGARAGAGPATRGLRVWGGHAAGHPFIGRAQAR